MSVYQEDDSDGECGPSIPSSLAGEILSIQRVIDNFLDKLSLALILAKELTLTPDKVKEFLPEFYKPLLAKVVSEWPDRPPKTGEFPPAFFFDATSSRSSIANFFNSYEYHTVHSGYVRPDDVFCSLVHVLFSNHQLLLQLREEQEEITSQKVLKAVQAFLGHSVSNMTVSPQQEMTNDVKLEKMYHFNQWAKEEIRTVESKVMSQKQAAENNQLQRREALSRMSQQIVEMERACRQNIEAYRKKKEDQMAWELKVSEHKQNQLSNTIKALDKKLTDLKIHNQQVEEETRIKRHKLEQQLVAILKKFDDDVFTRQKLLSKIDSEFQDEQEQMRQLQEKYDEQDVEYVALMKEKQEYEEGVRDEALKEIYKKIAARTIQRFYRYYLMMCTKAGIRRKKGKGKKGKRK